MEDEIYIHEKGKKKGALRAKFLEAMNVITVGRSRNWLGEIDKGKLFCWNTLANNAGKLRVSTIYV